MMQDEPAVIAFFRHWLARRRMTPERAAFIASDAFLKTYEWAALRYAVLEKYGARCVICGRTPEDDVVIVVDHIRSRRRFPHLALEISNLEPACRQCNWGKGNKTRDWRPDRWASRLRRRALSGFRAPRRLRRPSDP